MNFKTSKLTPVPTPLRVLVADLDERSYDFNEIVKDMTSLHRQGIISDAELSAIIRYVSSLYIENSVTERVYRAVREKIQPRLVDCF